VGFPGAASKGREGTSQGGAYPAKEKNSWALRLKAGERETQRYNGEAVVQRKTSSESVRLLTPVDGGTNERGGQMQCEKEEI